MTKLVYYFLILFICCITACSKKSTEPEAPFRGGGYYIATTGNDENDGSFEKPWSTFDFALGNLRAGDTLTVMGGVYYVTEMIKISLKGNETRRITIQGERDENVIINGDQANVGWCCTKSPFEGGFRGM